MIHHILNKNDYLFSIAFYVFFFFLQGLECYLMKLLHCINMKQSDELSDLIQDISKIIKFLKTIINHATVIKPRLYLLIAYLNVLRGRKTTTRFYLRKAQKFATLQGNKQIETWIMQNKRVINLVENNLLHDKNKLS